MDVCTYVCRRRLHDVGAATEWRHDDDYDDTGTGTTVLVFVMRNIYMVYHHIIGVRVCCVVLCGWTCEFNINNNMHVNVDMDARWVKPINGPMRLHFGAEADSGATQVVVENASVATLKIASTNTPS